MTVREYQYKVDADGRVFHDDKVHLYDRAAIFGAHGQPAEIRS